MLKNLSSARNRKAVVLAGEINHGKSTLVGQLLIATNSIAPTKLEECRKQCAARGIEFEPAFLVDALKEERKELKTINAARVLLRITDCANDEKEILLFDTPGHEEFVDSLVTGAGPSELALFVVSALEPLTKTAHKQLHLLSFLGIREIVVFINKIDLARDSGTAIDQRTREINAAIRDYPVIIKSVLAGSAKLSTGVGSARTPGTLSLVDALCEASPIDTRSQQPFRFWVQDTLRHPEHGLLALGTVLTGSLNVGDTIIQYPGEVALTCEALFLSSSKKPIDSVTHAGPETALALKLAPSAPIDRGDLLVRSGQEKPTVATIFEAIVCNLAAEAITSGSQYTLRIGTFETQVTVTPHLALARNSLESNEVSIERYSFTPARIKASVSCILDNVRNVPDAGRFVLCSHGRITACGLIVLPENTSLPSHPP